MECRRKLRVAYGDLNAVTEIGDGAYGTSGGKNNRIVLSAVYADKEENAGLLLFDSMGGSAVEAVTVPIEAGKETATAILEIPEGGQTFFVKTEEGTELAERAVPEREGYLFKGWSLEKNGSEAAESVSFTRNADDTVDPVTIYALWEGEDHTISFDTAGGEPVEAVTAPCGSAVSAPAAYKAGVTTKEKGHYVFRGWSPEVPETMPACDLTVTAQWEPVQYSMMFMDGDKVLEELTIRDIYGASVSAPKDPEKEGYEFGGWKLRREDGTESAKVVKLPKYMPDTNPVYAAYWLEIQEAPAAPEAEATSPTTVEVKNPEEGLEYSIREVKDGEGSPEESEEPVWVKPTVKDGAVSMEFSGLKPGSRYSITARRAGDEEAGKLPSGPSAPAEVQMPKMEQEAPAAPSVKSGRTEVEVDPVTPGCEYSIDGGKNWVKPDEEGRVVFEGLKEDTLYEVTARYPETKTQYASKASDPAQVRTGKPLAKVVINGIPKVGKELTASALSEDVHIDSWQWYRDNMPIEGATGTKYIPTAQDVGKRLSVKAVQKWEDGEQITVMSDPTEKIVKADGGKAATPTLKEKGTDTIVVETKDGEEYSIDGGKTWQESGTFTGLQEDTEYRISARMKETPSAYAGAQSDTLNVRTDKKIPVQPGKISTLLICGKDVPEITVNNLNEAFVKSTAGQNALDRVAKGENLVFTVEVNRIDNSVTEAEIKLADDTLKQAKSDAEAAMYLDISVYIKIGEDQRVKLTDLEGNKLVFSMTVPASMAGDGSRNRTYYVVMIHSGSAGIIAANSGQSLSFESDRFSTYVLGYADESSSDGGDDKTDDDDTDDKTDDGGTNDKTDDGGTDDGTDDGETDDNGNSASEDTDNKNKKSENKTDNNSGSSTGSNTGSNSGSTTITTSSNGSGAARKTNSAKTEDSGNLFLYLTMMLLSAVCAAWVSLAGEKKRKWK